MRAKISSVVFKREVDTQNGKFYSFTVLTQDGLVGEYLAKNNPQTFFVAGQEAEFETEQKEYNGKTYTKFKPVRAGAPGGFKVNPVHENKRVALKCTVDLVCAKIITENQMKGYYQNFLKQLNDEGT